MGSLFWLTDAQMARLEPFFPKSHGKPRVGDRRVLSGIVFIDRNGLRWCDAPKEYGPHKTLYSRWKRWSERGVFAPSRDGDSPVLPDLLGQIREDEQTGTVTADGAHDTRRCHKAITDRRGTAVIPTRRNGCIWQEDCPAARARNDTLRATQHYGRAFWKRWTGYHARSRIEAKMRCLKSFGERIMARDPDRQTIEIHIRIALMNRFSALGTADIARAA